MRPLLHTEFNALLARANLSQADLARLTGLTTRQINKWARGHAAVPRWATILVAALQSQSAVALDITLEEAKLNWHEVLGIAPRSDPITAGQARMRLALLYHPDKGGTPGQWALINTAYDECAQIISYSDISHH